MSGADEPVPLNRAALARRGVPSNTAPVRIVHLGLGAFHRAHQAWYTAHASDAGDWGIAAFTGRDARMADVLDAQDGLFCLVERGPASDSVEVVTSIGEVHDGARVDLLAELVGDPTVALVTLTITEAGYRLTADGTADLGDAVVAGDIDRMRAAAREARPLADAAPRAALSRLLAGLDARRRNAGGAIAVVPCDNLPGNGELTRTGLLDLASRIAPDLADWITDNVAFVSTSVDRITPRLDSADVDAVASAGWVDAAPVITEPFSDWTLSGEFPAGRPDWESAGARFVDDIEPWENRKLWLLNGAHSLLAYDGMLRGHETVAEAIGDPECRRLVDAFWAEAVDCLPGGIEHAEYRTALLERFGNQRIVHHLEQIAAEGSAKVRFRFASVAEQVRNAGGDAAGSLAGIAAWIRWLLSGGHAPDARRSEVDGALAAGDPVASLARLVSPTLAADPGALGTLRRLAAA